MKRFDFPLTMDCLFYAACGWLLTLCILRYYRVPTPLALLSATAVAFALGGIAFLLLSRSRRKRQLGKREREERDKLLFHLALENPKRTETALAKALRADGKKVAQGEEGFTVEGKRAVIRFSLDPLPADEIARTIAACGREFLLLCNSLTPEAEKLLSAFSIERIEGDEVCALFTRTDTVPNPLICGTLTRSTPKMRLKRAFARSNARPFFVSGACLLVMSLFTFFPVYYLVSGGILLTCSAAVRLFGSAKT